MLRYCSLYSGSTGNSFFVQSNNTNILIDAGVSLKKIVEGLNQINIDINLINGILVTHEHIDHVKSLSSLSNKYNIPVYANERTFEEIRLTSNIKNINIFNVFEEFNIGDLKIFPFNTPHDAINPCGFNISNNKKTISIATDLGNINDILLDYFKKSSSILLEANYDPNILKYSSYPPNLKQRISSQTGHLSNVEAGKALAILSNYKLKNALLIHLSKENNFPELAYQTVYEELNNCKNVAVDIAPRNNPSKLFEVS